MDREFIFIQLADVRKRTVAEMEQITEAEMDVLHDGFNNTIRWNFGHICAVTENLAFKVEEGLRILPKEFHDFFDGGTSPRQWNDKPPSVESIAKYLTEQSERIESGLINRLDEKLSEPIIVKTGLKMETVREVLSFVMYHEGVHLGVIKSLCRIK